MARVIEKINQAIKVATGRQLSEKQMARFAPKDYQIPMLSKCQKNKVGKRDLIYREPNGTFTRVQHRFYHTGGFEALFPFKTVVSVYDSQGKLAERDQRYCGLDSYGRPPIHKVFTPAGSWVGKRVSDASGLERVA